MLVGKRASTLGANACRLANVIENALKKEQLKQPQDNEASEKQLSQAAQAVRNSSALQQMMSQINRPRQEVMRYLVIHTSLQEKEVETLCHEALYIEKVKVYLSLPWHCYYTCVHCSNDYRLPIPT